jgi:hypothetical protein
MIIFFFIDETHDDISYMNTYRWNKIEVIFDKNTPNNCCC